MLNKPNYLHSMHSFSVDVQHDKTRHSRCDGRQLFNAKCKHSQSIDKYTHTFSFFHILAILRMELNSIVQ